MTGDRIGAAEGSARPDRRAALPQLRAELQLLDQGGGSSAKSDGAEVRKTGIRKAGIKDAEADTARANTARHVVFDPLRNRYVSIDRQTAELLSLWGRNATAADLAADAARTFGLAPSDKTIDGLCRFLVMNELVVPTAERDWRRLAATEASRQHGWVAWAIHNYLFVKIPLLAPEPLLTRIAPYAAPLFTRSAAITIAAAGAAGLYLVSRQWDRFLATFPHMVSIEGAATFAIAIAIVKSLHELGHALTAVRYGCRVPSMGVCFMVLVPMLYTDVSDAWRLPSRAKRFAIGAAGLAVELSLAAIALFVWAFLPEGAAKSLAFALATTSIALSLALNLNPFMRFDGYYLLCDATGIDNLQPRAFAVGRWQLREVLFGLGMNAPEPWPRSRLRWMAIYAWATWVYRLIVFTGIALLVYHLTFKLLGIILFLIEIVYFIALPVWRELRDWSQLPNMMIATRRTALSALLAVAVLISVFAPWPSAVVIPAIMEDRDLQRLFPRRASVVVAVHGKAGDPIEAGGVIAELASPELDQEIALAKARLAVVELRLRRLAADAQDRQSAAVLQDTHRSLLSKLAGLSAERAELSIVAQSSGTIAELDPDLHPGRWVKRTDQIAIVRGMGGSGLRGYLAEGDFARIDTTAIARFVPDEPWATPFAARWGRSIDIAIDTIGPVGSATLDIAELSSRHGGPVAARPTSHGDNSAVIGRQDRGEFGGGSMAVVGQFLVTGHANDGAIGPPRTVRGTLHARGQSSSLAARLTRQVLKVLVRESGF